MALKFVAVGSWGWRYEVDADAKFQGSWNSENVLLGHKEHEVQVLLQAVLQEALSPHVIISCSQKLSAFAGS